MKRFLLATAAIAVPAAAPASAQTMGTSPSGYRADTQELSLH